MRTNEFDCKCTTFFHKFILLIKLKHHDNVDWDDFGKFGRVNSRIIIVLEHQQ